MSLTVNIQGQQVVLLDENQLALVNNKTKEADSWLLDTFFGRKVSFNGKDAVPLDELETSQPLAPFVSPLSQGKPITAKGDFQRKYVKAAYLKPAGSVTPDTVFDTALLVQLREAGIITTTNGMLSRQEQLRIAQIGTFNHLRKSIANRKLLMATDILMTGKTICVGDDYPSYEINFGRDAALNFTPSVTWNNANATPITDIETMNDLLIEKGGTAARMALMSSAVFNQFAKNAEVKERFRAPLGANAPSQFAPQFNRSDAPQYRGELDGIQFWTYDVSHRLNGTAERFINAKGFYLISDTQGYQAQCEIKHLDAYGQALEYFDYQVVEKDPSAIKLIVESSPLIVPSNPNGVAGGAGFIA